MAGGEESVEMLLEWCVSLTNGYSGVSVEDLDHSWRDGLALAALVHRFCPDCINFAALSSDNAAKNLHKAQEAAKSVTGVTPMLCVEDWADQDKAVDSNVLVAYLSALRQAFEESGRSNGVEEEVCAAANGMENRLAVKHSGDEPSSEDPCVTAPAGLKERGSALAQLQSLLAQLPQPPSQQLKHPNPPLSDDRASPTQLPSARETSAPSPQPSSQTPSLGLSPQPSLPSSRTSSPMPDSANAPSPPTVCLNNTSVRNSHNETPSNSTFCSVAEALPKTHNFSSQPLSTSPSDGKDVCDGSVNDSHSAEEGQSSNVSRATSSGNPSDNKCDDSSQAEVRPSDEKTGESVEVQTNRPKDEEEDLKRTSPVHQLAGEQLPASADEVFEGTEDRLDDVPDQLTADGVESGVHDLLEEKFGEETAQTRLLPTSRTQSASSNSPDEGATSVQSSSSVQPKPRAQRKHVLPSAPVPAPRARPGALPKSAGGDIATFTSPLPAQSTPLRPAKVLPTPAQRTMLVENCHFCGKRVFTLERLEIEGVVLHRKCVRCHECGRLLHELSYDILDGRFLCTRHYRAKLRASRKKSSSSAGSVLERHESATAIPKAEDEAQEEAEFAVGVEKLQKLLENSLEVTSEQTSQQAHACVLEKSLSATNLVESHVEEPAAAESAPKTKRKAPAPPGLQRRSQSVRVVEPLKRPAHKKGRAPPPPQGQPEQRRSSVGTCNGPPLNSEHGKKGLAASNSASSIDSTPSTAQEKQAKPCESADAQNTSRRKRRAPPPPGQPKLPPAGHRRTKRRAPPVPKGFQQRRELDVSNKEPRTLADIEKLLDELDRERQIQEEVGIQLEELIQRAEAEKQNTPYLERLRGKWDLLLQKKQNLDEEESYLLYLRHDLELIQTKANIEADLRRLMEIDPARKTPSQKEEEKLLLEELVEVVDERNHLLEGLEAERIQESEGQTVADGKVATSKPRELKDSPKGPDKQSAKDKKRAKEEKEREKKEKKEKKKKGKS